ncbi:MAG: HAD-IB family phosphatase [Candidatus Sericytochromatia bacterium]|nr:HAD-IB family phosphatase [Candidatus Sericytochromatia bacterium]
MPAATSAPVVILCDFDGTVTLRDSNDALVEHFVGAARRLAFDRRVRDHRAPLWQVLDEALQACNVSLEVALAHLLAHVPLDPDFAAFSRWCEGQGWPVRIVSAGVHEVIAAFLAREGLEVPIAANRARLLEGCFGLVPADPTCPTGVDKAGIVQACRAAGAFTVFLGDGMSDRLAVPHADLVLAKGQLAAYCAHKGLAHVAFPHFSWVRSQLEALVQASLAARAASSEACPP